MSKQEIEAALKEINDELDDHFEDDDVDRAVVEDDDELKLNEIFTPGAIKKLQGIKQPDYWDAKPVKKAAAFGMSEDSHQDSNDAQETDDTNDQQDEDNEVSFSEVSSMEGEKDDGDEDVQDNEDAVSSSSEGVLRHDDQTGSADEQMETEEEQSDGEQGEGDSEEDNDEEDEVDQLIRQNRRLEKTTTASETRREDVINQKRLFDTAMDIRVKLQGMVRAANGLPPPQDLDTAAEDSEAVGAALARAEELLGGLLEESVGLLEVMAAQAGLPPAQQEGASDASAALTSGWDRADAFYVSTLESWRSRVTVMNISKFSQEQGSVAAQVEAVMRNKRRLVARTQQLRGVTVLGHPEATSAEYVFDDSDFYQQLVKDVVEKDTTERAVPAAKKQRRQKDFTIVVFPKLENFMSPVTPSSELGEVDRDVLIANLFK